jgi:hypothetical protein
MNSTLQLNEVLNNEVLNNEGRTFEGLLSLPNVWGNKDRLGMVYKPITSSTSEFWKNRLNQGRHYEDSMIEELQDRLGVTIDNELDRNDDGRFDVQFNYKDWNYTIECKGHEGSRDYGRIYLVVYERGDWKPWLYVSDLYCGYYWEEGELYSSYISVETIKDEISSGRLDKYKREGNIGWNNGYCIGYTIPTKVFRSMSYYTILH